MKGVCHVLWHGNMSLFSRQRLPTSDWPPAVDFLNASIVLASISGTNDEEFSAATAFSVAPLCFSCSMP
ncbi:hypothetical protein SLEP1_g24773 [Rubroshorea leprosula]|uniref:Uncharacterized protein n=1 Tax=Rubroshorea leprosula TaxID=152421 RepID=A0AAV5JTZ2_9ROSI|nr:hypothetical protein SLEP1_g24773 [Rubroshorea leprosula]